MEGGRRLVWITRAEPRASLTAERVRRLGDLPVVSPLLRLEPTGAAADLDGVGSLAFTSANGVQAFAAASPSRHLPTYAVGDATAAAARTAGFTDVVSADGDVAALARLIAHARPNGIVLHPGAAEPAGDLAGALVRAEIAVRPLALYRAVEAEPTEALTLWERLDVVLLHSPRAAQALERLMAARGAPNMRAVAISPAAAEPLKHLELLGVSVTSLPKEQALLNLLRDTNPL